MDLDAEGVYLGSTAGVAEQHPPGVGAGLDVRDPELEHRSQALLHRALRRDRGEEAREIVAVALEQRQVQRARRREGLYNRRNLPTSVRGAIWLADLALRFSDETVMCSPPPWGPAGRPARGRALRPLTSAPAAVARLVEGAKEFYGAIFGWKFDSSRPARWRSPCGASRGRTAELADPLGATLSVSKVNG